MVTCPECKLTQDVMVIGYSIAWCPCGCVFTKDKVLIMTPPFFDENDLHKGDEVSLKSNRGQEMIIEFTPLGQSND